MREDKWFVFKMNGRWCAIRHYWKEGALQWAHEQFIHWDRDMRDDPPYSATFEEAMAIVAKRLRL